MLNPTFKSKIYYTYTKFVYGVIFFSFFHTVLRPSETSSISLFRILLPILLFTLLAKKAVYLKYFIFYFLYILFNFITAIIYSTDLSHFIVFVIHYSCIFAVFISIHYLINKDGVDIVVNFLINSFIFILLIGISEFIFEFNLPNVSVYHDGSRSSVFWTQNEFGTGMLAFSLLIIFYRKIKFNILVIPILLIITYINDSKIAFVGILLVVIISLFLKLKVSSRIFIISIISIVLFLSIVVFSKYILLDFRDGEVSLYEFVAEPIFHIFTLEPFPKGQGSIMDRSNASIYAITEFINSNFLGIGLGNTLTMLEKPEFFIVSAKSIHNLPLQIIVENGILGLVLFGYLIRFAVATLLSKNSLRVRKMKFTAIFAILLGSLSSSVGIHSNYYFIATLAFIFLVNDEKNKIEYIDEII